MLPVLRFDMLIYLSNANLEVKILFGEIRET